MSEPIPVKIKSEAELVANGTGSHGKSNGKVPVKNEDGVPSRKQRRKEWWDKQNKSSDKSKPNDAVTSHADSRWVEDENGGQKEMTEKYEPNDDPTSTEQRSKLRNRNTIAKPDSLKYERNYNRGFHTKIIQNLFTEVPKTKKRRNNKKAPAEAQKRKSSSNTGVESEGNKKPKPAEESEIVDLYKFSLNLINGEVDTSKTTTSKDSKNKYVLFIGNLPYDITREQLEEHFRKTGTIEDKFSLDGVTIGHHNGVRAEVTHDWVCMGSYPTVLTNISQPIIQLVKIVKPSLGTVLLHMYSTHCRLDKLPCGIKSIRIPRDKITDKGRGFAYMEFDGRISHGIALRLHHTTLGGRKINVEFTSIGGGKSEARKAKLQRKNSKRRKIKY